MSATIIKFFKDQTFDPDVTRIMDEAYDMACKELHRDGQHALVQEVIAKRIIRIASAGERDAKRMSERAIGARRA